MEFGKGRKGAQGLAVAPFLTPGKGTVRELRSNICEKISEK